MRKLVVLVIVLMAAGAMVFADGAKVTFTGGVEGGAKIVNTSSGTTIQQYTNNEGTTGWANLAMDATLGDTSADFYLRSTDFNTWTIPNAWVTQKLFNDMLELRAGNPDNSVSATANKGYGGISGVGIQVVAKPISGLSIGGLLPAPLTAVDINDATLGIAKTFKVGAAYSMPNLADVVVTYLGSGEFDAGVNVTAMSALTFQLEANVPTASGSTMNFFENATYAIGSLTAGANALEALTGSSTTFTVTPTVSYAVSPTMTVFGQVGYTTPGNVIAPEVGVKFPWNAMGTLVLQYDGSFGSSTSHTININFFHSF